MAGRPPKPLNEEALSIYNLAEHLGLRKWMTTVFAEATRIANDPSNGGKPQDWYDVALENVFRNQLSKYEFQNAQSYLHQFTKNPAFEAKWYSSVKRDKVKSTQTFGELSIDTKDIELYKNVQHNWMENLLDRAYYNAVELFLGMLSVGECVQRYTTN